MSYFLGYISDKKFISKEALPKKDNLDWVNWYRNIDKKNISMSFLGYPSIGDNFSSIQPYARYADDYVLLFSGRIYNASELRSCLLSIGCDFQTNTDEEILYLALINWGIDKTLDLLNGAFVFAFYNINESNVLVARDHIGIKTIYFTKTDGEFCFSTDLNLIFSQKIIEPFVNRQCLGEFFAQGWVCEPDTLFENIYKLEAGSYISVDIKNGFSLTKKKYWEVCDNSTETNLPDIKTVIENQLIGSLKIGNYFSGGIDSSILAYYLKDKKMLNLHLSLGDSESLRVKTMRDMFGLDVRIINPDMDYSNFYPSLVEEMGEPVSDPAIISTFLLGKTARENDCEVMMSGMGGDEIDAGYPRAKVLAYIYIFKILKYIPTFLFKFVFNKKRCRDISRLKAFLKNPVLENYFTLFGYFNKAEISSLVGNDWYDYYAKKIRGLTEVESGKRKFFLYEFKGFLASHNNLYGEKISNAAGVECRTPLLDKDICKYYFKDLGNPRFCGKKRLTKILKDNLGSSYFKITKSGFRFPIEEYLLNNVDWNFVRTELLRCGLDVKVFDNDLLVIKDDIEKVYMKLWTYYTFALWHSIYIKQ